MLHLNKFIFLTLNVCYYSRELLIWLWIQECEIYVHLKLRIIMNMWSQYEYCKNSGAGESIQLIEFMNILLAIRRFDAQCFISMTKREYI